MMYETYDNEILNEFRAISHPRLGVVGGGQLAKMTALAALQLGCEVIVLERNNYSPAAQLATQSLVGNWDDPEALIKLASKTDVVSIENEFLDPDALEIIEKSGRPLYPSTATLRRIQDKLIQKQTLSEVGLETPQYAKVNRAQDIVTFAEATGWPVVLKTRRNGYDGKGNFTVSGAAEVSAAWSVLDGNQRALYVEEFCEFTSELATIITRGIDGSVVQYPVVETVQSNHICHLVRAPAQVSGEIAKKAAYLALKAIEAIDGVGSFGVEMFLTRDGRVMINELAPRVHNSGHYTIDPCVCSQFENHVRAVMGWPLGSAEMLSPVAVMVNLLGSTRGPGAPSGMDRALGVSGAHVHIYGKAMSGSGRKMGHITAVGKNLEEAEKIARQAADLIQFGVSK